MEGFYLDGSKERITWEEMRSLGFEYCKLDADKFIKEGKLDQLEEICSSNKYSYRDYLEAKRTPDFKERLILVFREHLHEYDEVRFLLNGSGYYHFRTKDDRWAKFEFHKGDFIILPAGMYHKFNTNDEDFYVMRLFSGDPDWTLFFRSDNPTDEMNIRKKYLQYLDNGLAK